jgi:hypothetical protein
MTNTATLFNFNHFMQEDNYWAQQSVKDHVQSKIRSVKAKIIFEYEMCKSLIVHIWSPYILAKLSMLLI